MNQPKCYIAGKIGDLPEDIYKINFEVAEEEVLKLNMIPVNPIKLPHDHDKSWESYMKEDIKAMIECTTVYALKNWRHSPGAREEIRIATLLGLNIIHQK